jgi:tape measure domain-containing protein
MPGDQLVLDVQVRGGADALRQLDALKAKTDALPATLQQGGAAAQAAGTRMAESWRSATTAMEREQIRLTAAIDREARKAADAQEREIQRAMRAELREFDQRLRLREQERRAAERAAAEQARLAEQSAVAQNRSWMQLGAAISPVSLGIVGATTAVLGLGAAVASTAISMNSQLGQARTAFMTLLGSAEAADAFLRDMADFARTTPFEFPDLVRASQRLLAMGIAAEQVRPLLTAVGNAAAALGSGQAGIDRITTALGQMTAKTKVQAEEMMQLTEAGIPAWDFLAKKLNTDVAGAMDLVTKRAVDANVFLEAFQEGVSAKFGDQMAAQARTYAGAMSNLTDSSQMAIAKGLKPLFDVLTETTVALADLAQSGAFDRWATNAEQQSARVAAALRQVGDLAGAIGQHPATPAALNVSGELAGFALAPQLKAIQAANAIGTQLNTWQQQAANHFAPTLAESLINGVQEQRIGERLAATLSHETYLAGQAAAEGVADGLDAGAPAVINASERIANQAGAIFTAMGGNVQRAIQQAVAEAATVAQAEMLVGHILEQANAARALTEALATLTPAERARYEVLRAQTNAQAALNTMYQEGRITGEQYTSALERGTLGLTRQAEVTRTATSAAQAQAAAVEQVTVALERQEATYRRAIAAGSAYGVGRGERTTPEAVPEGYGLVPERYATQGMGTSYSGGGFGTSAEIQRFLAETGRGMVRSGELTTEFSGPEGMARLFEEAGRYARESAAATAAETVAQKAHTQATQAATIDLNTLSVASGKASAAFTDHNERLVQASTEAYALSQGLDFVGAAAARTAANMLAAGASAAEAAAAARAAAEQWKVSLEVGKALMAGQMVNAGVAGRVTPAGLTTSQIYGGGGGSTRPLSAYGLPIVSELTPGTLRGYAEGALVLQPHLLVNARSGAVSGIMAERGPEPIGWGGGGVVNHWHITVQAGPGADEVMLRDTRLWERVYDLQLGPVMRRRGVKV